MGLLVTGCGLAPSPPAPDVAVASAAGDAGEKPEVTAETALRRVATADLPLLLDDGDLKRLRVAVARSRDWFRRQPGKRTTVVGPRVVSAREMDQALSQVLGWLDADLSPEQLAAEMAYAFDAFESVGDPDHDGVLVTGYFEPVIDGSLSRRADYPVPVYRHPGDIVRIDLGDFDDSLEGKRIAGRMVGGRLRPYPDRQEIRSSGFLRGKEIAWARDPVDLFFLEIQGSGSLRLPDGRLRRIGYAGSNGRSYRSIGRLLIDEGAIPQEKMSMQALRTYLDAHPDQVTRILDHNASQVFFRFLDGPPLGSLGVPVTPGRSIATDSRLMPRGALGFLVSEVPRLRADGTTEAERPLTRFVLNQDTGGAIRGAGRVDFFWGRGGDAGERAGAMKQPGRLFFLVPKAPPEPPARPS